MFSVWVWSFPPTKAAPGLCCTPSVCRSSAPGPTSPTAPSTPLITTAGTKTRGRACDTVCLGFCGVACPLLSLAVRFVSVMISAHNISYLCRWTRISIPLPNAALTETTRFRWKQSGSGAGSMWAVDNGESYDALSVLETFFFSLVLQHRRSNTPVKLHKRTEEGVGRWLFRKRGKLNFSILMPPPAVYMGPACLRFCSGRGHCSRTGCK